MKLLRIFDQSELIPRVHSMSGINSLSSNTSGIFHEFFENKGSISF